MVVLVSKSSFAFMKRCCLPHAWHWMKPLPLVSCTRRQKRQKVAPQQGITLGRFASKLYKVWQPLQVLLRLPITGAVY